MRISIDHSEKTEGLIRKTTYFLVTLKVEFSEEEKQIIKSKKLENTILMEREIPANEDPSKYDKPKGLGIGIAVAVLDRVVGYNDPRVLRMSKLLKGADTHVLRNPLRAKEYEHQLKTEILPLLKEYIQGNSDIEEKSSTFEL